MNKHKLFIGATCLLVLTGCDNLSPWRPELEEFIFKTNINSALNWTKKALLTANCETKTVGGEIIQYNKAKFYFAFEENNLYYHLIQSVNDNNYDFNSLERKMYLASEDTYKLYENKDGTIRDLNTTKEYIVSQIKNFFYTSTDNNFKGGGMFKGDDFKTMSGYQNYICLDEEKNELIYTYVDQQIDNLISNMLYRINSYGMMLNYSLKNEEPNVKTSMIKFDIKYNDDVFYDESNFTLE